MKLRLDALVIQQGKLSGSTKGPDKDFFQSAIRFGAQQIFKSTDATMTDEDIDTILYNGELKTQEFNSKLTTLGQDSLQSFTFDTEPKSTVHEFEGEDYRSKQKNALANFIEPPRRERKQAFYPVAQPLYVKNPKQPRGPKSTRPDEFQFFPRELIDLLDRELNNFRREQGHAAPHLEGQSDSQRKLEQMKIDISAPLTEEQLEEKEQLLQGGFDDWSKRDFNLFIKANEKWGRLDLDHISADMQDFKEADAVREYSKVFWKRYAEIPNYENFISAIEKGEQKIQRRQEIQQALDIKCGRYKNPFHQLKILYGTNKGKNFTEEEDRYLICMLHRIGYDKEASYEDLRRQIRVAPQFRFDWFLKSRTPNELQRRCNTLINLIERENSELAEKEKVERKKKAAATAEAARAAAAVAAAAAAVAAAAAKTPKKGDKRKSEALTPTSSSKKKR